MRGAPIRGSRGCELLGIIPADAGSTPARPCLQAGGGDHPRGCGEHLNAMLSTLTIMGSSPRMRGALLSMKAGDTSVRIIPADAGSTSFVLARISLRKDHPRGCGEHRSLLFAKQSAQGSSPRMRGAQSRFLSTLRPAGIIPADAGSTSPASGESILTGDHPRGCGEHHSAFIGLRSSGGSSPRMRGAHSSRPAFRS